MFMMGLIINNRRNKAKANGSGKHFMEAMTSKIILMMPKNQELSKFQRIRLQESRFKNN